VKTETLVLRDRASVAALRRTDANAIVVDTIAAPLAGPHLAALRNAGKRIAVLALMEDGALRLARRADLVIAASEALARELRKRGIPSSRITVVRPGREALPAEAVSANGKLRILCVANWSPSKGIHRVLEASALIPDAFVDLVGDEPDARYAARVRRIATRLAKRARIRGVLRGAALRRRYAMASIFALPSTRESYGMAVADALAHGLPVVACDIPATREVTGDAAVLVPAGDDAAFRDALRRLAASEGRRAALGRRARARARRLPTWVEMEVGMLEAVEGLLLQR
jgi:glycosyltransferase involved in cell wall biosynthesis